MYKIVAGNDCNELEQNVNKLIKDGFKPIGNMIVYFAPEKSNKIDLYLQSMFKELENLPPVS